MQLDKVAMAGSFSLVYGKPLVTVADKKKVKKSSIYTNYEITMI